MLAPAAASLSGPAPIRPVAVYVCIRDNGGMDDSNFGPRIEFTQVHQLIDDDGNSAMEEVRRALRMPSFSDTGEGIGAAAEHFATLVGRVCPDATIVPTEGYPVVLGTVRSPRQGAPTLIVYGLYDVTPTMAAEWTVDPLAAEIVEYEGTE